MQAVTTAQKRKTQFKIIFTGPVGAGKTTAITALSDVPPVTTDETAHDMTQSRKASTTVAMDYGVMTLDGGERIHLYGTPGQERFDFMWDILTEGGLGLILLLDNSRADPFQDLRFFVSAFKEFIADNKLVVGVTFMDKKPSPSLNSYHRELKKLGFKVPILEVDGRAQQDVSMLIQALLFSHDPWLGV